MAKLASPKTDDFAGWSDMIGSRDSLRIGHNTYAERLTDGSIGLRLHGTYVLTYHADNRMTLRSGGYETVTTKQRLNALLPQSYAVQQEQWQWYLAVRYRGQWVRVAHFRDGMTVPTDSYALCEMLTVERLANL